MSWQGTQVFRSPDGAEALIVNQFEGDCLSELWVRLPSGAPYMARPTNRYKKMSQVDVPPGFVPVYHGKPITDRAAFERLGWVT